MIEFGSGSVRGSVWVVHVADIERRVEAKYSQAKRKRLATMELNCFVLFSVSSS